MPKQVKETTNVSFDEALKTFRLVAGNTLYALCLSPELALEHLYWGSKLPEGYDLRYLSQSCRMSHFNTVEEAPHSFEGKIALEAETLEEIQKTWKMSLKTSSKDEEDYFQKRRVENYSWRILSKISQQELALNSKEPKRRKSVSVAFDMPRDANDSDTPAVSRSTSSEDRRRRSVSMPAEFVPQYTAAATLDEDVKLNMLDLYTLSKISSSAPSPSPSQRVIEAKSRALLKHHTNRQTFERQIGKIGKGTLCVEYTDYGTGDFRTPSFMVVDGTNGSALSPLRYRRHKIYRGKLPMPDDMPSIRSYDDLESSTLVITLGDANSGLEVDLIYVAMHNYDAITRRAVFRNCNYTTSAERSGGPEKSKVLHKACSATIDFEFTATQFHLTQLCGSWARETYKVEMKLHQGMHSFGSTRGVSSHQQNPFAAITVGESSETSGEVKGFSLVYSGNFLFEVEVNEMGRLRVNMGIHPMGLQWYLKEGGYFATPEAVLVRSNEGLGGMSRTLHKLFLDRLIPKNWSDHEPPILLNSWEGKYFHVNHDNILEMARQAAPLGITMIVLDDGWFGKRTTDRSSLGDWVVDLDKFPYGLNGLVDEINALGLKFGLWFEPEMVSEQSALFAAHPEWAFQIPGRHRQIGRNQMVLDLSRQDVRDHVYNSIAAVLSSANIEYIKWDMNRPLTEVYSILAGSGEVWQAEVSHRYVLGVYELQGRILKSFPKVLFENCASGGGRFDPGMLYFSPQIWCSDNTDALVRMRIQYGTSLAYPARCIGSHVSVVPNHLTGNTTRLRTRGFVAMCGTFGYELDVSTASASDRVIFQKQCEFFRQIHHIVRWGELYRLWDPFKMSLAAWMYVSRDKSQAVVFAFSLNSDHWSNLVPRLQLQGLLSDAEYVVSEPYPNNITQSLGTLMLIESEVPVYQLGVPSMVMTGDILMSAGLPMKFYTLDDSAVFVLTQNKHSTSNPSSVSRSPLLSTRARSASAAKEREHYMYNIYDVKEVKEHETEGRQGLVEDLKMGRGGSAQGVPSAGLRGHNFSP